MEQARHNKSLQLTRYIRHASCISKSRADCDRAAELRRYAAPKVISMFGGNLKLLIPPVLTSQILATDG